MKKEDFLYTLSRSIHLLPFEARKDSQAIFSHLFRFQYDPQAEAPVLSYVCNERPEVLINLCCGYSHKESSAPCGTVLREILKHEDVTAVILYAEVQGDDAAVPHANINTRVPKPGIGIFWLFFNWIDQSSTFEIIADALNTFRVRPKSTLMTELHVDSVYRTFSRSTRLSSPSSWPTISKFSLSHSIRSSLDRNPISRGGNPSSCSARFY